MRFTKGLKKHEELQAVCDAEIDTHFSYSQCLLFSNGIAVAENNDANFIGISHSPVHRILIKLGR
jgi:hypothetical protein